MLRATLLVKEIAAELKSGQGAKQPLLVVGGGAAGATAALTASNLGIDVLIVERAPFMFSRQIGVTTRRLHATEYDWPQDHAGQDWPPDGHADLEFVFEYKGDEIAAERGRIWQFHFDEAIKYSQSPPPGARRVGRIHELTNHHFKRSDLVEARDGLTWKNKLNPLAQQFGSAIFTAGQGTEKITFSEAAPTFQGVKFWGSDGLESPYCEIDTRGLSGPLRVLVSGGGDGAQQDLQRIVAGEFGHALTRRLHSTALMKAIDARAPDFLSADLLRHTELSTAATPEDKTRAIEKWGSQYSSIVETEWNGLSRGQRQDFITKLLRKRPEIANRSLQVTWVQRSRHTSYCYGLNKVLTDVCLLAYAQNLGRNPWDSPATLYAGPSGTIPVALTGCELHSIKSANGKHTCRVSVGSSCYGISHNVEIAESGTDVPILSVAYDIVVVRHGLKRNSVVDIPPGLREQYMPFGII